MNHNELEDTRKAVAELAVAALTGDEISFIFKDIRTPNQWIHLNTEVNSVFVYDGVVQIETLKGARHELHKVDTKHDGAIQIVVDNLVEFNGHITNPPPADGTPYTYDEATETWSPVARRLNAV